MHQINTYMKSAANCDVHCKLQNPVSQYDFECDYVLKQFLGVLIFQYMELNSFHMFTCA